MNRKILTNRIKTHLQRSAEIKQKVAHSCVEEILSASEIMANSLRDGNKILLCGNGGSAADCQHMAAEFVSRLTTNFEREALAALALTTDTSFLTAYANDCDFETIFVRQVQALGRPGDVLIGITTSGRSPNVLRALDTAQSKGLKTIALVGTSIARPEWANVVISVQSDCTQFIQESHLSIEHILCDLVECLLFRDI